ncbi:Heterokaryon incompatibility protein 6 OR allele [Lachnellula suecica]|uniref:Heterokaryon incompatibility protein 6 OR allele n=1 Tax=Lachnellula suecica TaxID=602035 RepID=A0A8T9C9I0_9HELO|nr:Heterokaryon incompatibility protein 6 OR allele [Lachnellula suecica]
MFSLHKLRQPLLRTQRTFPRYVARYAGDVSRSGTGRWSSSVALKSSASAYFIVSLAGFILLAVEPTSTSNVTLQFENYNSLQNSTLQSSDPATDTNRKPPPSNTTFTYPRLSDGENTRLVILEPGEVDAEFDLSSQEHTFFARSRLRSTLCSGMKIPITPNLDGALRQLRYTDRPRVLWVDAICINQGDMAERSRQVRIMQRIYANAIQVVVWLGRGAQDDARSFESLQTLKSVLNGQGDSWFLVRLGWYRDKNGRVFSGGAHRSMLTDIEYNHLITLLRRDWFRRTWVIQEVASSQKATVYCEDQSIPWEVLADVYMRLGDRFLPVSQLGGEDAHRSLENITAIERARRSHSGPLSLSLFHILLATSFSKCKDQRDKIFAVVGLAKNWVEQKGLLPDYDTREEAALDAFKDFAVTDIDHHRDLRVLSCASGSSSYKTLPSWVPDWRKIENVHPFPRYSDRTKFRASGGMKPEAWYSDNKTVLHVAGIQVDSIATLGSEPIFTKAIAMFEINAAKITDLERSFLWLEECETLSRDHDGLLTVRRRHELWRTLTCGLTGEAFPAPSRYSEYFDRYIEFMSSASDRFKDYLAESLTTVNEIRGLDEVIPHFETHAVIEASLDMWSARRRFALTHNGRLACVPKNTKEGDVICILFGGEAPFVLRPTSGGFYAVVGECYVNDIMQGESLSHDTISREFRLR